MLRLLIGVLLSAVVLMAWGFVFWMVLPFAPNVMQRLPDDERIARALSEAGTPTGTYFYPYPDREAMSGKDPEAQQAFIRKHSGGPLMQISYRREGVQAMDPAYFAVGFGHMLAGSLLAGVLLLIALPRLPSYPARVGFVFLVALFATVSITLGRPIWFHHPWRFALLMAGFHLFGWLLSALVLALVIRPRAFLAQGRAALQSSRSPALSLTPRLS
jgi:hypothetical protein